MNPTKVSSVSNKWNLVPSKRATRTSNPIRKIVDQLRPDPKNELPIISLALGDPCVFGNLPPPSLLIRSIEDNVKDNKSYAYGPAAGVVSARETLAREYSLKNANGETIRSTTMQDVIIASGASGALEIAINGLMNEGDSLLIPNPGFALYQVLAESLGGVVKKYELNPSRQWEIDLESMENAIDDTTKAIVINNPSNPCGNILPRENLLGVVALAEKYHLPIIADEIYDKILFSGQTFTPIASLTTTVPILTVGGLAKQFAVPGFRVGWIIIYDNDSKSLSTPPEGSDISVRQGLMNLTTLIVGANTLTQSTIPAVFPEEDKPEYVEMQNYYKTYNAALEANAKIVMTQLEGTSGLTCIEPQAAMYVMVRIEPELYEDIKDDVEFCAKLLQEKNIVVLPGQCFGVKNFFRIVFCPPLNELETACTRIKEFVHEHARKDNDACLRNQEGINFSEEAANGLEESKKPTLFSPRNLI